MEFTFGCQPQILLIIFQVLKSTGPENSTVLCFDRIYIRLLDRSQPPCKAPIPRHLQIIKKRGRLKVVLLYIKQSPGKGANREVGWRYRS